MATRARWSKAWLESADGVVLLEFWDSPDIEPVEAVFDDQKDYVGIVLHVASRNGATWERQSLERHIAEIALPIAIGDRPLRDVKPRRSPAIRVAARHGLDPDRD